MNREGTSDRPQASFANRKNCPRTPKRFTGVMMRMNAEKIGDDVIEVARWREASCRSELKDTMSTDGSFVWPGSASLP